MEIQTIRSNPDHSVPRADPASGGLSAPTCHLEPVHRTTGCTVGHATLFAQRVALIWRPQRLTAACLDHLGRSPRPCHTCPPMTGSHPYCIIYATVSNRRRVAVPPSMLRTSSSVSPAYPDERLSK